MKNHTRFAAAFVALVALVGCKNKLDNQKLQTAIADGMKGQSLATKSVTCPADREAKKGDTFDCDAVLESGDKVKVKVEQTDDQGNVNWKVDAPAKPKDEAKPAGDKDKDKDKDEKAGDDDHK